MVKKMLMMTLLLAGLILGGGSLILFLGPVGSKLAPFISIAILLLGWKLMGKGIDATRDKDEGTWNILTALMLAIWATLIGAGLGVLLVYFIPTDTRPWMLRTGAGIGATLGYVSCYFWGRLLTR